MLMAAMREVAPGPSYLLRLASALSDLPMPLAGPQTLSPKLLLPTCLPIPLPSQPARALPADLSGNAVPALLGAPAADTAVAPAKQEQDIERAVTEVQDTDNAAGPIQPDGSFERDQALCERPPAAGTAAMGVATPPAASTVGHPSPGAGPSDALQSPDAAALNVFSNPLYSVAR